MANTLLQGAFLLTNENSFFQGDLRIANDTILEIAPTIKAQKGEKTIFLRGQVLIPGFVQTHTHLCQTLFRNLAEDLPLLQWLEKKIWPMEAKHTQESLYASARLGIGELLSGGTTTILDMGTVNHTDAIFTAAKEMGIRAFIGKCMMDQGDPQCALLESTEDSLRESIQLANKWHGKENDRLRYAFAPRFAVSCTSDLLSKVRDYAKKYNLLIHTHASENQEEVAYVRDLHGCNNVEYLHQLELTGANLVLAHCVWLQEKEIELLASTQTKVSHCPSSNLKLASGIAGIPHLLDKGVCVSLGADGAACNNNLNMFQEMRLAGLIQKYKLGPSAMPAKTIFEMATKEGARTLGLEDQVGSLKVGKKADLVALDLQQIHSLCLPNKDNIDEVYNSIVYSGNPTNVTHTWVDGTLCYHKDKAWSGLLEEAIHYKKKLFPGSTDGK